MINRAIPIVVDRGKKKSKAIRRLKRGEGTLYQEVNELIELTRKGLGTQGADKTLVPVVVVYKKKRKSSSSKLRFW